MPVARFHRHRSRLTATGLVLLWLLVVPRHSAAYNSVDVGTSVFPSRWMLCKPAKTKRLTRLPKPGASTSLELVPVPHRSAPSRLQVLPDVADEVAVVDPVPVGAEPPQRLALQPEPPVLIAGDRNDYRCLGQVRGKAGILRVLSAPPGARFYDHQNGFSWIADNMLAAASWNIREAIPFLRATLARPLPPKQSPWRYERLRSQAAVALAELGDRQSAAKIVDVLRDLDGRTYGAHWADVLRALGRLAPEQAEVYAVDLLTRLADGGLDYHKQWGALLSLDYLTERKRDEALAVLRRLTANDGPFHSDTVRSHFCELMAARLRLGDELLLAESRRDLSGELRKKWPVYCYSQWMPAVFGRNPDDAEVLLKRRNYELIIKLLEQLARLTEQNASDAAVLSTVRRARTALLNGLRKQATLPAVSQPKHRDYHERIHVRYLAALAGLGDDAARKQLYHLIDTLSFSDYEADAPYDGAFFALRLGLPDAMKHALIRLRKGLAERPGNHREFEFTGSVTLTSRVRLLEQIVRQSPPGDARWTVALLDYETDAREKALFLISRRKPAGTCAEIAKYASQASEQAVRDGFWGLSVLGLRCQDAIDRLASDVSPQPYVRGMAVELLAMVRSPKAAKRIRRLASVRQAAGYRRRARVIDRSRY